MNIFDKVGSFLEDVGDAVNTGISNLIVCSVEMDRSASRKIYQAADKTIGEAKRTVESVVDALR